MMSRGRTTNGSGEDAEEEKKSAGEHGARDRANEEVFISQNGDRNLKYFPSEAVYSKWREDHLPALMSTKDGPSTTMQKLDSKPKRQQFW